MSTFKQKFNRTNADFVVMDLVEESQDGKSVILETLELDVKAVPSQLANGDSLMSLASYGLLKLVQDRNSQLSNKYLSEQGLTGKDAIMERMKAYKESYQVFLAGNFKAPSIGRASTADPILCEAVAKLKGVTAAVAATALKKMSKDEIKAIRELPKVLEMMDEVREEMKAAESLDLTSF